MSTRRKAGDIVRLVPNSGFIVGEPDCNWIISNDGREEWCLHECGDELCGEWVTLYGIDGNGMKNGLMACHVSECQMYDREVEK